MEFKKHTSMHLDTNTWQQGTGIIKYQVTKRVYFLSILLCICSLFCQAQPIENEYHGTEQLFSVFDIQDIDSALASRLRTVEEQYGIKIYSQEKLLADFSPDTVVRAYLSYHLIDSSDASNRNMLLNIFAEEWAKYPPAFVKNMRLRSVVFVSGLAVNGQRRYAMPDAQYGALYFDADYVEWKSDEYLRHCIHHEFHHLVQFKAFNDHYYKDPTWSSFNSPKFKYGGGGATAYKKKTDWNEKHPQKGFMTPYSTYGVEEDMAELFAFLMTTSEFPLLMKWMKKDRILEKKVAYLLGMIATESKELNLTYLSGLHGSE